MYNVIPLRLDIYEKLPTLFNTHISKEYYSCL